MFLLFFLSDITAKATRVLLALVDTKNFVSYIYNPSDTKNLVSYIYTTYQIQKTLYHIYTTHQIQKTLYHIYTHLCYRYLIFFHGEINAVFINF
jgi:hypothetical protein